MGTSDIDTGDCRVYIALSDDDPLRSSITNEGEGDTLRSPSDLITFGRCVGEKEREKEKRGSTI